MYFRSIKLGVMCKTEVFWRHWRQEKELKESAISQTRENEHEGGSGPEDVEVYYNTDALTFKGQL